MKRVVFVGAGLANLLIAYRLRQRFADLRVLLLERKPGPAVDRTWSFYQSDVSPQVWEWLSPLAAKIWDGYEVRFPSYRRHLLRTKYASLRGEEILEKTRLMASVRFNAPVQSIKQNEVCLENGERIPADAVIVGKGFGPASEEGGFQKFFGLQLLLKQPHGLTLPTVMDTCVPQDDGFRFVYVLPWNDHSVLVEDTYYSNSPSLDKEAARARILDYARGRGWEIEAITGEESSALPIPFFASKLLPLDSEVGVSGYLFHPVTGYSLPWAAAVAEKWNPFAADSAAQLATLRQECAASHSFYRVLNRMLFLAARPEQRRRIFERFYRLPEFLVQRFYAGKTTRFDKLRILSGKPPVAIVPALKAVLHRSACP